jgi:hypothetical protein
LDAWDEEELLSVVAEYKAVVKERRKLMTLDSVNQNPTITPIGRPFTHDQRSL